MFADGVFCEFAVFEEEELAEAVFPPGRIVWKAEGVDEAIAVPQKPIQPAENRPVDWLLGEALTNLLVGLMRDRRGEKLTGMKFIQGYAVDRVVDLADHVEIATLQTADPFSKDRRFEFRYPHLAQQLPDFLQGYGHNKTSALAILAFLDQHFPVNTAMKNLIMDLCRPE